jgi:alkylation response protein AidB-like acyl-CoA dehydrogenase
MSGRLLLVRSFLFKLLDALERRERVTLQAAALKLQATEMAVQAAIDTVQLLGGAAYVDGNRAVRVLCDAKLHEIGAGTSEIMKLIIFRETIRQLGLRPE